MANFLCIAFIPGLSAGVQAMASRRFGEGKLEETAVPLNGGLMLAMCFVWFLLNLLIESSVIGLELIYEHRLYLPSLFIVPAMITFMDNSGLSPDL